MATVSENLPTPNQSCQAREAPYIPRVPLPRNPDRGELRMPATRIHQKLEVELKQ